MTDLLQDIALIADELCNPIRTVERIQEPDQHRHVRGRRGRAPRRIWTAVFPSLLEQLAQAVVPGESFADPDMPAGVKPSGKPGPREPARLEAIARLLAIEAAAAAWCVRGGISLRDRPAANILALVGAAGRASSETQQTLLLDMRGWHTWAAVASGWQRPDDAPRGTCPACGARNTIRVRLAAQRAFCAACGAWWDEASIGILAAHIAKPLSVVDTAALRTAAVLARREWESRRAGFEPRPDLPYVEAS